MLPPEGQLLAINAVVLAVVWFGINIPSDTRDMNRLAIRDLWASAAALLTAGALFWGSGIGFSLVLFEVNWFWFSLITLMLMELPIFLWYCRTRGIDLRGPGGD